MLLRKYQLLILIMFFLCVFCLGKVNAIVNDYTLLGKSICIDPGHGGY